MSAEECGEGFNCSGIPFLAVIDNGINLMTDSAFRIISGEGQKSNPHLSQLRCPELGSSYLP
jgi:hypothetical protein